MELYKLTRNVARRKRLFEGHGLGFLFSSRTSRNKLQNVNIILRMPPMPFPMPRLFITAVKDVCTINTSEKLLKILFSEVYC